MASGAGPIELPGFDMSVPGMTEEASNESESNAWGTGDAYAESADSGENPFSGEIEAEPSPSPSVGRSILGSLSSFLWIAMLIAFSLSRSFCSE